MRFSSFFSNFYIEKWIFGHKSKKIFFSRKNLKNPLKSQSIISFLQISFKFGQNRFKQQKVTPTFIGLGHDRNPDRNPDRNEQNSISIR